MGGVQPYRGSFCHIMVEGTHCYTVNASHASTPPPLLPALHVPHYDRCCDSPLSLAIVPYHTHRLGRAPRLRRRCLGVGVRPLLRVWDTRSPVAPDQQEAAAE